MPGLTTKRAFVFTAVAALLVCSATFVMNYWPASFWQPLQQQLESKYKIRISLENIEFPANFRAQKALYRKTLPIERTSVLKRLALDLSRYPESFITDNLQGIVVLRSLELNGLPYGGTYDLATGTLFIDSAWLGDDGSSKEAMGLHHEFSSILMHRHPETFKTGDWMKLNPKNYKYQFSSSSAANLATDKLDLVGSPSTWEQGFLCSYGQLTLEDDINTFAQYMVAKKSHWSELAKSYPQLAEKMLLLESWYHLIGFTDGSENTKNH